MEQRSTAYITIVKRRVAFIIRDMMKQFYIKVLFSYPLKAPPEILLRGTRGISHGKVVF
jgi:hypothetical protein